MSKIMKLLASFAIILLLSACREDEAKKELDANDTEKAEAKVGAEATKVEEAEEEVAEEPSEIWTYYDNAKWSEDFAGLKTEIQKVVVTDIAPTVEDENAKASAVGVKFKIENTTDHMLTTYPDQAVLITSTGEQIDMPDMWISDDIGGDIHEGVIKEGNVIWYLERGQAEAIEWIKLEWTAQNPEDDNFDTAYHTYSVKLDLK